MPFGTLAYQESAHAGQGLPVLLLHGACADHSSWLGFAHALGKRWRLLVPDLPAHGMSSLAADAELGITAQAERVLAWLDALGLARVHLMGHSMGGALALRLAHLRPGLVATLILIDSAGVEHRPSELRAYVAQGHKHPMIEVDSLDDYRDMLAWGMARPPWLPGFALQWLLAQKRPRRATERRLLADLERDQDQRATLGSIRAPTLILWGQADRILHPDDAALLEQGIAGSRKRLLPGLGHVPMVEDARLVAGICRAFLQESEGV